MRRGGESLMEDERAEGKRQQKHGFYQLQKMKTFAPERVRGKCGELGMCCATRSTTNVAHY